MQSESNEGRDLETASSDEVDTDSCHLEDRRDFLASTAALGILPLLSSAIQAQEPVTASAAPDTSGTKSLIGDYGSWAAGLTNDPPQLSFRLNRWRDVNAWRKTAREKTVELIASPPIKIKGAQNVKLVDKFQFDGLEMERLSWQLPYGRETRAILLKPKSAAGPMPAFQQVFAEGPRNPCLVR